MLVSPLRADVDGAVDGAPADGEEHHRHQQRAEAVEPVVECADRRAG